LPVDVLGISSMIRTMPLVTELDRAYFAVAGGDADQVGAIDNMRAVFGLALTPVSLCDPARQPVAYIFIFGEPPISPTPGRRHRTHPLDANEIHATRLYPTVLVNFAATLFDPKPDDAVPTRGPAPDSRRWHRSAGPRRSSDRQR